LAESASALGGQNTTRKSIRIAGALAVFVATFAGPLAPAARADQTFTVNSTADVVDDTPGDGACDTGNTVGNPPASECTLRAAVQEANALVGADTINLPASQYVLSLDGSEAAGSGNDAIGDLDVTDDVTIDGAGAATTSIRPADIGASQATISRGFELWGAGTATTISDVEILKGNAHDEAVLFGGSVRNNASVLVFERVRLTDGGACSGGGLSNHGGSVTITDSTLRLNDSFQNSDDTCTTNNGAAVYSDGGSVTVDSSTVAANDSDRNGGGLYVSAGTLSIVDSEIDSNSALEWGGGVAVAGGTLTVDGSTMMDNASEFDGGAVYQSGGQVVLENSTLSNNGSGTSSTSGDGGALFTTASATLKNVTAAFNSATSTVGGIATSGAGEATLRNTILSGSSSGASGAECNAVTSEGGNLIEDTSGCSITGSPSTYVEANPMLLGLGDNGGPTPTHKPNNTSPAIDGGDNTLCLSDDQRGFARPDDGPDADAIATCDIGAYEWNDTDNDGLQDIDEPTYGTDINDPDTDDDGMSDGAEVNGGFDPRNPCDPDSSNEECLASADTDLDGIFDQFDNCDGQPEDFDGWQDLDGCPDPDNDGDGVLDGADQCDASPEDVDGWQDSDGCPDPDNDGDGVLDGADPAPNNQCVPDSSRPACDPDGDGIANSADNCDNAAEDFDSFQDSDGCPESDNDQDGNPDVTDNCDNAAEDFDSFQDSDGCPDPDNDGDGVLDGVDPAPNNPCVPSGSGPSCDPDGDGIANSADSCDNQAEDFDSFQDSDGCPDPDNDGDGVLDGDDPDDANPCVPSTTGPTCDPDGDGIVNSADNCDNQAEDLDGFEDANGCPDPDNDGDGVPDTSDDCDNQAEDLDGFEDANGCPEVGPDADSDGIDDGFDDCDAQPEDEDGFQDADGCPDPDNDGDGVDDGADPAPNDPCTPSSSAGPCDADGDGLVNSDDNCPTVSNGGQENRDSDSIGDLCDTPHKVSVGNFALKKHVIASGKLLVSDTATKCTKQASVSLQLKKKVRGKLVWKTVAKGKSTNSGTFSIKSKDVKGPYRVVAAKHNVTYSSVTTVCSAATSKTITHKH
jgi:CSLREA domain-containing protein